MTASKNKFTIKGISALKPGETVWHPRISGLGCRCQQAKKVFILKYRFHGRQRLYTIGKFGDAFTTEQAADEAMRLREMIRKDIDPAAVKKAARKLPFLAEAFTVYLEKVKTKKSPRTYDNYKYLYEKYIKKELGQFQIDAITRADIARLHHKHANKPHTANRLLALFSTFLTWCERHGHRTEGPNPCRHIEKYRETPRDPGILSEQDLFKLGKALNAYEQENMYLKEQPHKKVKTEQLQENPVTPYVTAAIRLLIFTGARRNEILTLKWENVDFQNRQLRLQESKTGQKSIYLSAPALQLLSTIPRVEGNPYVICGKNEGEHLVNIKNPWGKIRKKAGLEKLRLHDLRHNYASTAVATGHHLKVVGALLGHSEIKTTERYAHLANDPVQTANETVSNRILNAMMGKTSQDNVVKIPKAG